MIYYFIGLGGTMNLFYILLIFIIFCSTSGIVYVLFFNKMQYLRTKIEQAEGIIDETLRKRYDALVRADNIIKTSLQDGKDYFKEFLALKNKKISNFEMDRKLKEAFALLYKFKDDYPDLGTNKELKEIFSTIKETDEKIAAFTSYYNKNTTELNEMIRKFPSNMIGKIHHFQLSAFFDGKNMNDDIYDDFKL